MDHPLLGLSPHDLKISAVPSSQLASTAASKQEPSRNQTVPGATFLKNIWYCAMPSTRLKPGKMIQKKIMGELVLIGRDAKGKAFALKDFCPHQGVPLTEGKFDGREIECCFHGWRFNTGGVCTAIPSLLEDQEFNLCRVKTEAYPCREVQGLVWVYIGKPTDNLPEVPAAPGLEGCKYDQTTTTLLLPNHIDYNVVALIDTAHVPYIHKSWWWRSSRSMKPKMKTYVPDGNGWTMVRHKPSKQSIAYKVLGDLLETEIGFRLPGCRIEKIIMNNRTLLAGITALTPIDETHTELNHTTYWTITGFAPLVTPFIQYFVSTFLGQDRDIAKKQEVILKNNPSLIVTIKDAGTPGRWYFDLKREWTQAAEENRPFVNPIKESILRWRT
jgi:phenylpropionate dioxygenase-like ring-hydroxylating dioxygenase large terminal subunit